MCESVIDLTTQMSRPVTPDEVNGAIRSASRGRLKGVLEYCTQPVVSSDVVGNTNSAVFDALSIMGFSADEIQQTMHQCSNVVEMEALSEHVRYVIADTVPHQRVATDYSPGILDVMIGT